MKATASRRHSRGCSREVAFERGGGAGQMCPAPLIYAAGISDGEAARQACGGREPRDSGRAAFPTAQKRVIPRRCMLGETAAGQHEGGKEEPDER